MKKLTTISLIILFLLYQVGFIAVYWMSIHKIDDHWLSKTTYNQPLKKISIPISMPYWVDQGDFVPVDGKIEIGGIHYRKVLQKYEKDTIHLMVVRDVLTEKLESATQELINAQNNSPVKKSTDTSSYSFLKNDLQVADDFGWNLKPLNTSSKNNSIYYLRDYSSHVGNFTPPPQRLG